MSRDRMVREGPLYTKRKNSAIDLALICTAAGIMTGLCGVTLKSIPPVQPHTNNENPVSVSANATPTHERLTPSQIVDLNIRKPDRQLLEDLREMFHKNGRVAQFYDCDANPSLSEKTVINPVNLREAPTRMSKVIRELAVGEQVTAPIQIAVDSLYKKAPSERWVASIEGTNLSFAAQEDAYRTYLINNWGEMPTCKPMLLDYDYLREDPPRAPIK